MPNDFRVSMIQFWCRLSCHSLFLKLYPKNATNKIEHLHTKITTKSINIQLLYFETYVHMYNLYVDDKWTNGQMSKCPINQDNDNTKKVSFLPGLYDYISLSFPRFLTSYLITLNYSAFYLRCKIYVDVDNCVAAVLHNMGHLKSRCGHMDDARIILERFIKIRELNQTDNTADFVNSQ